MNEGRMVPARSKGEHKTSREKKPKCDRKEVASHISQKKKKHVEEAKRQDRSQNKRERNEQVVSEDISSDRDDIPVVSVQGLAKREREVRRPKEGRERDFKEEKEKRDCKAKEGNSNRRRLMYKEEKSKRRLMRHEDQNSGEQHSVSSKSCEPKDAEDSEKHALKRKCKGQPNKRKNFPETESFQVESEEGSSWKQESCPQRCHDERREQYNRNPHCKASSKAARRKSEGDKKTHVKKSSRIFSKASPLNSEGSSCSDSQDKCSRNQRRWDKDSGKKRIKAREDGSFLEDGEEELCSKEWLPVLTESQLAGERRGCQEPQETTSENEGKPEIVVQRQEFQDEGSDSEVDEKIKGKHKRSVTRRATPTDSNEHSDSGSSSDSHYRSHREEESENGEHENPSEKGNGKEDSCYGQNRSGSEDDGNERSSLEKGRRSNKARPLPSPVSLKLLKVGLSKTLQGNHQAEEGMSVDDQAARAEITSSPQPIKHKSQSPDKLDTSKQSTYEEEQTSQDARTRMDAVALLAKRYSNLTSQSQILLNLKSKHKDAKAKLLASGAFCPPTKAAEIGSDWMKTQSIHPKKSAAGNNKVRSRAKVSKESRSSLSTASSSYPNTKKLSAEKKKKAGKVIGKVKMASHQAVEAREEEEEVVVVEEQTREDAAEKDLTSKQTRSRSLQTLSTFRKVTHWLSHKPSKKASLKDRFLNVLRTVGISGWFLKKIGKKKRRSKPFELRRRMAIRIVSTVGLAKRCSRPSRYSVGEQRKKDLSNKRSSCSLLECGAEDTVMEEEPEERRSANNFPCNEVMFQPPLMNYKGQSEEEEEEEEEEENLTDAIVFPRIHQLVKSNSASLGSSGNSGSHLPQSCNKLRRKVEMSSQPGSKLQHDFSKPNGKRNGQGLPCSLQADASIPVKGEVSSSYLEEEEDMVDLIQRATPEALDQVHWSQYHPLSCDPAAWLNSETLLPRLTIENLSKWTLYKEQDLAKSYRTKKILQGRWEAEDVTEDTLEKDVAQNQIYKDEDCYMEPENVEDLSRLQEVCESSVLLCLKKRFHRNFIYTYIGNILICVNPFKHLNLYAEDVVIQYQKEMLSRNAPHIFAITEMAYAFSQSSEKEQCIVISGHSGSGKTEVAKAIVLYLSRLYQRQENQGKKQPSDVLPILESFGNAKTILNDNSSRFGKFLHVHLRHGFMVGTSISQYLLEKSRVVFQGRSERSFHVFYELLAGLPLGQKEELYLQESETYFYLNQGRVCELPGKQDDQDFLVLINALQMIGLSDDQLTSIWAVLAGILQLGNICFTSCEKESFELAAIPSETEIQIVANLLHISADLLQRAITHRITETCYDRIFTPLSVESAIDARDAIAKALYSLLFDWLLMKINEWLAPSEMDRAIGIVDIHGFEDLGVNSLEQLCINFANEHLQHFFSQIVITQEEEEYRQEDLIWSPASKMSMESCLDLIAAKPHGILRILDDQTLLSQATDHTFLQKCHYHHANSPWYVKPKLPLPVFTVKHYAGPVTYQVHKFLNKNHNQLHPEILNIFSQSHLKLVSSLFQRVKEQQPNQRLPGRPKRQASTLVSRFQQSLQDLTTKLDSSHIFFVQCIKPNSKKVPNIFDTEYVACQLRHSGILKAIHIRKEGYPIRIPFHHFLIRYGALASRVQRCLPERDVCIAVLLHVVGDSSELYQIGLTKVFLKEKARQLLERRWNQKLSWAIVTLQRNLQGLINRRRFQVLRQKATFIQAHFRGYLARKRFRTLKKTLMQFGVAVFVSRLLVHRKRQYQRNESLVRGAEENTRCLEMDVRRLEIPAELAALLHLAEGPRYAQTNQVTEVSPPEVKAQVNASLPPDINDFPFSTFMQPHFQEMGFPDLGQPLQQPLTRLDAELKPSALQLNKLILRFIHDKELQGWQEELVGNYIARRGLGGSSLRDELLSQVASQVWKNPDLEQCQRGWVLMAALLGTFTPSPALEKPLLKFVSDHGLQGYNAVCQRKLLTSRKQTESCPEASRSFPPTQLEWTTNQRKGKMVLDVYTYKEERFSAEVESWTTGEQYAGWILSSRGLDTVPRGWSVSMFTGDVWQDLAGCDFVLDLIGEIEEGNWPSQSCPDYPITPEWGEGYSQLNSPERMPSNIPPAPGIQAPSFPPPSLPSNYYSTAYPGAKDRSKSPRELDHYVDGLFMPLLHHGSRSNLSDMESEGSLTGRMKGGGKIGPTRQGAFPAFPILSNYSVGYPGMMNMSAYQPMPAMGGMMPAAMPMMPGLAGMGAMPGMVMPQPQPMLPSVDPNQVAAQQQAIINQQALLMAQQMTLQAMTISQQQQQQQQQRERSPEPSKPRRSSPRRRSPERSRTRRGSPQRSPERSRTSQASSQELAPESSRPSQDSSPPSRPAVPPKPKSLNSRDKDGSAPVLPEAPPPRINIFQEEQHAEVKWDTLSRETFQKKKEYFQKMAQQKSPTRKKIPLKSWSPPSKPQSADQSASPEADSGLPSSPQEENGQEMKIQGDQSSKAKGLELTQKSEPSQEIRKIVKVHQNQPYPQPNAIMPVRHVSKPFVKKSDPKTEALAKLGIVRGPSSPSSPSPEMSRCAFPPPPPPPGKLSNSIKEKQLPLMNLFSRSRPTSPDLSELPPPPPVPPPPAHPTCYASEEASSMSQKKPEGSARTMLEDSSIKTQLISLSASVSFSYANPTWKFFLRKEIFYPKENFSHPYCLNLLCDQIIRDTYSDSCIRISKEERRKMKDLLVEFQVDMDANSIPEDGIKKRIVLAARDNWANYFSRLFPVKGENGSDVQILGVSHRGLQLLKRAKGGTFSSEYLKTLCSYSYADVLSLELMGRNILNFSLKNEQLIFHSLKAQQIKAMVELFLHELKQDSNYVIALRSYVTDDKSLLSFKKGDFIRLLPMVGLEPGWQFGSVGGRSGLFPSGLVQLAAAPDYLSLHMNRQEEVNKSLRRNAEERINSKENQAPSMAHEVTSTSPTTIVPDACHYTMTEFATEHFRKGQFTLERKMSAEQTHTALLVQHTKVPILEPLLLFTDGSLNDLATKIFMTLMRFMGDQPGLKKQDEIEYVYEILKLCKEQEHLVDEVYCQVLKQITQNPSQDSCHRGWLLLSLFTGYFLPSSLLMPYVTKYLQEASSNDSNPSAETARTCQSNLRKIIMCGGRRYLPFNVEMEALLKGRSLRQISINLPGGLEYKTKIKTFTVAADVMNEIGEIMGITEPEEIQEFAIFASKDNGKVVLPIRQKEYIHDYLLGENLIGLNFCKITWKTPLHFENEIYTNIHYNQVLQNYMKGKLLLRHTSALEEQVGSLALLQHWAKGAESIPSKQEIISYLPETVAHLIDPEIIQALITYHMELGKPFKQQEAKVHFIENVIELPLFSYNIYPLERVSIIGISMPCFVAVNEEEIIVVDGESQKLHCLIPLNKIRRMRTLSCLDKSGTPGLEVFYGSPEDPKIMRFELKQAKALYRTIVIVEETRESQI